MQTLPIEINQLNKKGKFILYYTIKTNYYFTFQIVFYKLGFLITNSSSHWKEISQNLPQTQPIHQLTQAYYASLPTSLPYRFIVYLLVTNQLCHYR